MHALYEGIEPVYHLIGSANGRHGEDGSCYAHTGKDEIRTMVLVIMYYIAILSVLLVMEYLIQYTFGLV